uniref:Uncharacterized protein n=1 Tax=Phlebotomus papatasi TaxID=29031 RepID=A0A1B0DRF1_PHLPP
MHIRIHTGDTPFQCSFCSKKLMQKRSLEYHLKRCRKNNKKVQPEKQINKNGDAETELEPKDMESVRKNNTEHHKVVPDHERKAEPQAV